jgi:hypothetical protein
MLTVGLWARRLGAVCSLSLLTALPAAATAPPGAAGTNIGASTESNPGADWPCYNRVLQMELFSPLA